MLSRTEMLRSPRRSPAPARAEPAQHGENGSVAVAVMVVLLISILSLAVLARSQSSLANAGFGTEEAQAEAAAEQALAEATAVLANGQTGDFEGSGTLPEGTYRFEVIQTGTLDYEIYAEATVGDRTRAVVGTVGGESAGSLSLFVARSASLDNAGSIDGALATNGRLVIVSGKAGDVQLLHGPDASCLGCSAGRAVSDVFELLPPAIDGVARLPCPVRGEFDGVVSGRGGRPVLCSVETGVSSVTFSGAVRVVNGPLVVEVGDGVSIDLVNADVNLDGTPADVQIHAAGTSGTIAFDSVRFTGSIFASGRSSVVAPAVSSTAATTTAVITGVLGIGELDVSAGNSLSIIPGGEPGSTTVDWDLETWEAVPAR